MKKSDRQALQKAFAAPPPERKQQFLRTLPQPMIGYHTFVLLQAAYMRKWVWLTSVFLLAAAYIGSIWVGQNTIWMVSALFPLAAVTAVTENIRSDIYGMAELEMASRFCYKSILLARMMILGILHTILFCFLIPICWKNGNITLMQTGVYLLVPYLLTTVLSLYTTRRLHGRETGYICMAEAVFVSGSHLFFRNLFDSFFLPKYANNWIIAGIILLAFTVSEYKKRINQMEELTWN